MARVKAVEPEDPLIKEAKEYAFIKQQMDYLDKQQKELKAKLFAHLDDLGEVDDKGNIILELPEEISGFGALVKQRRVSRKIDELRAEEIITEKGMEDSLYKTIRVVDEDALMAALYNDELTEAEVDEMYPQNIVWALVMNKR
jgi:uncharacterized protein YebE (UPF0316 family)